MVQLRDETPHNLQMLREIKMERRDEGEGNPKGEAEEVGRAQL